jgi:hypothetical protein
MSRDHGTTGRPIIEPEIIPPDRRDRQSPSRSRIWIADGVRGSHRVYVARLGPFGAILLALAIGVVSAALLALLLGAFLIGTLAIGAIAAFAMIAALLRSLARPQR